jgi:hypothetical protein
MASKKKAAKKKGGAATAPADDDDDALLNAAIAQNATDAQAPPGAARGKSASSSSDDCGSTPEQCAMPLRPDGREGPGGALPESRGRLFYSAINCLASVLAVPELQAGSANAAVLPQFQWHSTDIQANTLETRGLVQSHILGHIDEYVAAIGSGRHDRAFAAILGHRPTGCLRSAINGFANHIESDFFVVGCVDDGTVMVQLDAPDGSDETVFVVKSLATPIWKVVAQWSREEVTVVRTVLLPMDGCITYMSLMNPSGLQRTMSARDYDRLVERARGAYGRACAKSRVWRKMTMHNTSQRVPSSASADFITPVLGGV